MKPVHLLPPVLALAVAAIWLGSQHRSISALQEQSGALRKRIETARQESANGGGDAGSQNGTHGKKAAKVLDWKQLAEKQRAMQGGNDVQGMRAMIEMQRTLMAMSAGELMTQIDEIDALDLPKDLKASLQGMIIGVLAQKDPRLAVERFVDQIENKQGGMSWQLDAAFQQWATKDPAAAIAWMDVRIAEGKFASTSLDGKNEQRLQFERGLVTSLLASDPQAAEARIAKLPVEQRAEVLQAGVVFGMKPGSEKALADLIRHQMPEDQRAATLAQCAGQLVHQGGFERVDKFFGEIAPSQEEKDAVVARAFQNRLSNNRDTAKVDATIEEGRTWALRQSPDAADRITGEALGSLHDFGTASQLALKYYDEGGNDEVLTSFLESGLALRNSSAALPLLDKIADEQKREELRKRLNERG
jgi:hypothetical protein